MSPGVGRTRTVSTLVSMGSFFAVKLAVGFVVTIASAHWLSPGGFASFTQLLLFSAWLSLVATGGAVNGLVRQVAFHGPDAALGSAAIAAGLRIWVAVAAALGLVGVVLARQISTFLVGSSDVSSVIPLLIALAALGGLNQLLCAVLTARGRASESMLIQAAGLIISGVGAGWFLLNERPVEAVAAFVAGPAVSLGATLMRVDIRPALKTATDSSQIPVLLAHSAAHFTISTLPPLFLFASRSVYQEHFSLVVMALWLFGNRLSDLNTQLVGLFGAQVALPLFSAADGPDAVSAALRRCIVAVLALSLPPCIAFAIVGEPLVRWLLPSSYGAAVPFIQAYLIGDVFRSIVFIGMMWALARNRFVRYALIEVVVVGVVAGAIALLADLGVVHGPAYAYPSIYAIGAVAVAIMLYPFLRRQNGEAANEAAKGGNVATRSDQPYERDAGAR